MAENENGEEKTEEATEKKRRDARKKGQVLKSQDVAVVCSLFLSFFVLRITASSVFSRLGNFMTKYFSMAGEGIGDVKYIGKESFARGIATDFFVIFFITTGALLAVSFITAIVSTGIQTKFLISFESLKFKLDKLNPINGIKRMFSLKGLFELAKSLIKMILLIVVVYNEIKDRLPEIVRLMFMEPIKGVVYIAETVFSIVMTLGMVFIAVAAVDFMFQRYSYENDLKMTKQEVKDEYKQMEGDPKIKSKRRAIQQQMANQRMMQAVPEADVIIRNPTHFAVALKYDPEKSSAPVVTAKGKDLAALRIADVAAEHDVPTVENKPLARGIYEKVEVGREIPAEFYQAAADVLWFVYNLKKKPLPKGILPENKSSAPFNY
ncbi:MAG: flagellar biosynthesis protein FlhB [Oscillospiraceae bacterium]|nr:flagellar biosynthesis protein FlhB [Oscillospiraceae bacterium]